MNDTDLKALIARNPNHPKHGVPVPLILICNISGKETKYTAPEYIAGKIKAAGSLEALLNGYVSKGATKNAAGSTKAPSATKSWKGSGIATKQPDKVIEPSSTVKKEQIHRTFHFSDGQTCHVHHDRQSAEQATEIEHDFRKKKVASSE